MYLQLIEIVKKVKELCFIFKSIHQLHILQVIYVGKTFFKGKGNKVKNVSAMFLNVCIGFSLILNIKLKCIKKKLIILYKFISFFFEFSLIM